MRRTLYALAAAIVASAALTIPTAFASQAVPGVTAKTVTVGGTFPLSGPASSYGAIPVGMHAYLSFVNATRGSDGRRGVDGRQIVFKYDDDAYNPAQTVQLTRQLVEQDHVFALLGGLGTASQEAVRDYSNQQEVPQLYVTTGATEFGATQSAYPWTIGWQPDYQSESATFGRYIAANLPSAKIGVLYQDDNFGKDYIAGLEAGLGKAHQAQIAITRGYEPTDTTVAGQMLDLRAAGVDTVLIAALPGQTIQAFQAMAGMGWKPATVFTGSTGGSAAVMPIAAARAGTTEVNGTITATYIKDPSNPSWAGDPGMKLYLRIMAKYAPAADPKNILYLYGMAKAYTFVQALRAAGSSPTRAGLMAAALNMNDGTNPFLLPGMDTRTGPNDAFPISQQRLARWNDGLYTPFGPLIDTRPKGL